MLRKLMKGTAYLCLAAMLATIIGCSSNNSLSGESQPPLQTESPSFVVQSSADDTFTFVTPDGVSHDREWLAELASSLDENAAPISFDIASSDQPADRLQGTVGSYFYRLAVDPPGYVACFKRNVRHLNFMVRNVRTNTLLLDVHLAGWWDNGPQFGIYQSAGSRICARTTGNFTKMRQAIQDVLSRMTPLPYWVYVPLAYTVAVFAVGVLALAW